MEVPGKGNVKLVGSPSFQPDDSALESMWGNLYNMPGMDSIASQMVALEQYETAHGVCNHGAERAGYPIPLATHNASMKTDAIIDSTIDRLLDLNIPRHTGMSIVELLDLSTYDFSKILDRCRAASIKKNAQLSELEDELGDNSP